ncbi:MAG: family 20 glycosylhydrolase, partial [Bacteroidales bacterium]
MNLKLITVITYFFLPLVVMKSEVKIVPYPQEIIEYGYHIKLPSEINLQTDKLFTNELGLFEKIMQEEFRFVLKDNPKASFSLRMVKDTSCCSEGYKIKIDSHDICLSAASNTGMFYALQSLRQLTREDKSEGFTFPALEIVDYPYFSWRGFMLDDARAFKGVEVVKNLLDEMSLMKMNVFQWHLTEDQGWRIEIKKYPLLTEIGGRRDSTQLDWYENDRYDGTPLEGFYTQQQIKEIVEYAADRHITIVPEIEMPGHCSSAIASYPWLGCSGKQIRVPCDFGVMYDVFNVADTRVIQFLEDVLDEISTLFPSGIIHIGGDEVRYDQWN